MTLFSLVRNLVGTTGNDFVLPEYNLTQIIQLILLCKGIFFLLLHQQSKVLTDHSIYTTERNTYLSQL